MKAKLLWIGGVVTLLLILTIGAVSASQGGVFEGAWYADDLDGSQEWLWIENYFGAYDLIWYDDACSVCVNFSGEQGPSCLLTGSALLRETNILTMDQGAIYCYWEEGTEYHPWDASGNQIIYDPASDTINTASVTWQRSNDKKAEKIIEPIRIAKPVE